MRPFLNEILDREPLGHGFDALADLFDVGKNLIHIASYLEQGTITAASFPAG